MIKKQEKNAKKEQKSSKSKKSQKKHKKLKITLSVIFGLLIFGYALYKVSFNALAPVVFDYIVSKNPDAFLKLGDEFQSSDTSESNASKADGIAGNAEQENKNSENDKNSEKSDEKNEKKSEEKAENGKKSKKNGKNSDEKVNSGGKATQKGYSTETYIGTLTTADMSTVIKNISSADKTRIIAICKSVVAANDMPRFAKMATQGMSGDDYAYAESYLRSHLSNSQKKEIMEIVRKYLGR